MYIHHYLLESCKIFCSNIESKLNLPQLNYKWLLTGWCTNFSDWHLRKVQHWRIFFQYHRSFYVSHACTLKYEASFSWKLHYECARTNSGWKGSPIRNHTITHHRYNVIHWSHCASILNSGLANNYKKCISLKILAPKFKIWIRQWNWIVYL